MPHNSMVQCDPWYVGDGHEELALSLIYVLGMSCSTHSQVLEY